MKNILMTGVARNDKSCTLRRQKTQTGRLIMKNDLMTRVARDNKSAVR